MKLKTKELLDFAKKASSLTTNSVIPIYGYWRLKNSRIEKTNGRTFISNEIDAPGDVDILMEEQSLLAIVKSTNDDEISVHIEENKEGISVTLSDSLGKQNFQSPPVGLFTQLPQVEDAEPIEFDYNILEAIGIASKNTGSIGGNANLDFVHLKDGWIYSTTQQRLFAQKINNIPNAIFDTECASIIAQFSSVNFYQKGTYYFFSTGKTVYGFQQYVDVKPLDLSMFLGKKLSGNYFQFNTNDLLNFCDRVTMSVTIKGIEVLDCHLEGSNVSCKKSEYGKEISMTIPSKGEFVPNLWFNPKLMSPYLRSLGKPVLDMYEFKDEKRNKTIGVYLGDPEDENFIGMVAGLNL